MDQTGFLIAGVGTSGPSSYHSKLDKRFVVRCTSSEGTVRSQAIKSAAMDHDGEHGTRTSVVRHRAHLPQPLPAGNARSFEVVLHDFVVQARTNLSIRAQLAADRLDVSCQRVWNPIRGANDLLPTADELPVPVPCTTRLSGWRRGRRLNRQLGCRLRAYRERASDLHGLYSDRSE
jgi:hypothetical protein